jgi:hypothetical protein
MQRKTYTLLLLFLFMIASQVFACSLDHWWVRNESYINGIVYANNTFVAVAAGDNGTVLTSPDGRLWTERWSRAGYYFYGIARGNKTFVAVGWAGAILTSPDGLTWTERSTGTEHGLFGVVHANKTFVAVGWARGNPHIA